MRTAYSKISTLFLTLGLYFSKLSQKKTINKKDDDDDDYETWLFI